MFRSVQPNSVTSDFSTLQFRRLLFYSLAVASSEFLFWVRPTALDTVVILWCFTAF